MRRRESHPGPGGLCPHTPLHRLPGHAVARAPSGDPGGCAARPGPSRVAPEDTWADPPSRGPGRPQPGVRAGGNEGSLSPGTPSPTPLCHPPRGRPRPASRDPAVWLLGGSQEGGKGYHVGRDRGLWGLTRAAPGMPSNPGLMAPRSQMWVGASGVSLPPTPTPQAYPDPHGPHRRLPDCVWQ